MGFGGVPPPLPGKRANPTEPPPGGVGSEKWDMSVQTPSSIASAPGPGVELGGGLVIRDTLYRRHFCSLGRFVHDSDSFAGFVLPVVHSRVPRRWE